MDAKLRFLYGTMNAGKSLQILATAYSLEERHQTCILVKSAIDTRDEGVIHSRALGDRECIIVSPEENIYEKLKDCSVCWILVDEAQFLTEEQVNQLSDIVDYRGINVICYGLRTDFKTKLFPGSKRLFEIADKVSEIKSTCDCGKKNIFNARIDKNGNVVTVGKQVEVGGEDRYLSLCRKCYKERTNKN